MTDECKSVETIVLSGDDLLREMGDVTRRAFRLKDRLVVSAHEAGRTADAFAGRRPLSSSSHVRRVSGLKLIGDMEKVNRDVALARAIGRMGGNYGR